MINRPRRNRLTSGIRGLVRESNIQVQDLVWPTFVQEGNDQRTPIVSMPGVSRLSIDQLVADSHKAFELGIPAVALFPAIDDSLKNSKGKESLNPNGLLQRAVKKLKKEIPDMIVITDVALDPYSSDGHDGFVQNGQEVTFELASNGSIKVIYGDGVKKPTNTPKPKQKENTAKADNRELLMEDK